MIPLAMEGFGGELAASAFQNRLKRSGNELSLHGGLVLCNYAFQMQV